MTPRDRSPRPRKVALDFDALYRAARDDVYAYVATLLRDRGAAEDVTALAFERAYRKRAQLRRARGRSAPGSSASPATPRSTSCAGASAPPPWPPTRRTSRPAPDGSRDRALRRAAVRTALAALPPRDRELIALKFHAGLDNAELAAVLGVSPRNAGTLLHRAMTKLREAVEHLTCPPPPSSRPSTTRSPAAPWRRTSPSGRS